MQNLWNILGWYTLDGLEEGENIDDIEGCFALTEPISVNRTSCNACEVSVTPDDGAICPGGSIQFTATTNNTTGTVTYDWSATGGSFDDNTIASPTWTMMMPGTYTISVLITDEAGCMASAMVTATVYSNPEVNITPRDAAICPGGTVNFNANATGNGPLTYSWTATGGSFDDPTSATPIWTMMMPGTYTIGVVVTDANGCSAADEVSVTVNPNPEVDISPDNAEICPGGSVNFNANATGNGPLTYSWTATGGSFDDPTSATPIWTMMMPGTYTISVTVTDANGCSASDETSVTVHPNPEVDITPDNAETCAGVSVSYDANATGNGPFTYMWTASGGSFDDPTSATPIWTMMMPGTYTISVTVTDANGCSASDETSVTVHPNPEVTIEPQDTLLCVSEKLQLNANATGNGPFTYMWTTSGGTFDDATSATPLYMMMTPGTYTIEVKVTDTNGCMATASTTVEVFMRKIGDYVWIDENQDGVQNGFEDGFEGAIVKLLMAGPDGMYCTPDDIIVGQDTTDANGNYCFECVRPGKYVVTFDINNPDYVFTKKDFGLNDAIDSDADTLDGKTDEIMIMSTDGDDLTIDAGVHLKCDNLTVGGQIAESQTICPGQTPSKFTNVQLPTGGFGNIEYLWMYSTTPGPFDPSTWIPIPNSNSPEYQSGPLSQTTFFARCARRECCEIYVESNVLRVEVIPCLNNGGMNRLNATVINNGNDVELDWTVGPENDIYNYFIERSLDASDFELLGKVTGSGSTDRENTYSYIDDAPLKGKVYYRVKRVGLNSTVEYSEIAEVFIGIKGMKDIYLYPNPVKDRVVVQPIRKMTQSGVLEVIDISGKILYSQKINPIVEKLELDLGQIEAGIYYIRILENNSDDISIVKMVKLR